MHEGAIARSLLNIAHHHFLKAELQEVAKVTVIIGRLHHIVPEVLELHFDLLKKDLAGFEQAALEIEQKEVVIRCRNCHQTTLLKDVSFACPHCASLDTELIQGDELYLASIEGVEGA